MAKEKKVEQITDMEVDFAQWYTDICRKAELVEYASAIGQNDFAFLQSIPMTHALGIRPTRKPKLGCRT